MVTALQFAENLTDRQAADAVRGRIDWEYGLGLELTNPGFDFSVLSQLRTRLVTHELRIAGLIAEGLSDREIAARLVVSRRTAESHVEHIVTELGFNNRSRVAAWMAGQQPGSEKPSGAG
jgi:DNA-binding NarL/FixJ family response regulator